MGKGRVWGSTTTMRWLDAWKYRNTSGDDCVLVCWISSGLSAYSTLGIICWSSCAFNNHEKHTRASIIQPKTGKNIIKPRLGNCTACRFDLEWSFMIYQVRIWMNYSVQWIKITYYSKCVFVSFYQQRRRRRPLPTYLPTYLPTSFPSPQQANPLPPSRYHVLFPARGSPRRERRSENHFDKIGESRRKKQEGTNYKSLDRISNYSTVYDDEGGIQSLHWEGDSHYSISPSSVQPRLHNTFKTQPAAIGKLHGRLIFYGSTAPQSIKWSSILLCDVQ